MTIVSGWDVAWESAVEDYSGKMDKFWIQSTTTATIGLLGPNPMLGVHSFFSEEPTHLPSTRQDLLDYGIPSIPERTGESPADDVECKGAEQLESQPC